MTGSSAAFKRPLPPQQNMDNDYEPDSDNEAENEVDLTGFLFGNIDSEGRLVDDIFDTESKKQLGSLAR